MRLKKLLFLFLLINGFLLVKGQETIVRKYPGITKGYILSGFKDTRDLALSPVHWKGKQWMESGALTASGLLLYTQETRIRAFALSHQSSFGDRVARYGLEPWGSGLYSIPLVSGMYIYGRVAGNDRLASTALTAAKAACITSLYVEIAKQLAHRHRPYQDEPSMHDRWDGPFSSLRYTSFPSGHSAFAFSIASVIASEYQETVWVPVLAYTLAGGTALSRIYNDKHWSADVLIGSAFGIACGRFLWKLNRKVLVMPSVSTGMSTMSLVYQF
jgi:membrane-associated phospholipid phosphatase